MLLLLLFVTNGHSTNLFRKPDYFPNSMADFQKATELAGHDGYGASYDIADLSDLHPNLADANAQTGIPHQTATTSLATHSLNMHHCLEQEAQNGRVYSEREHAELAFETSLETFKDPFRSKFRDKLDTHSDEDGCPRDLTPSRLPYALEKWKKQFKIDIKTNR